MTQETESPDIPGGPIARTCPDVGCEFGASALLAMIGICARAAIRDCPAAWCSRVGCSADSIYDVLMSSTKSAFGVDLSSPVPLHEQVAAAIRRAIADGEVGPGDRLPPARDLAAVLGVNANTVFRALRALRDEGV